MKIQSYFKILVSLTLLVFLASCSEDFLVEEPRLDQSSELTLSSFKGLDAATAGSYSLLCDPTWYGVEMVVFGDLKGGLAKRGSANSGRYVDEYLWNNTPTSTAGFWSTGYYTIARANNVINAIDDGFEEAGVEPVEITNLKGEALFLRALAHFDLVRIFAQPYSLGTDNPGVPVVLITENQYPERNTVGEVYDQVVEDLLNAIELLPDNNKRGSDGAWADKNAAKALLARVYLYMEQWQNAADMATDVIDSGNFSLWTVDDYTTYLGGGYWGGGGAGDEIIFQVDGSEGNSAHGYWLSISYLTNPDGYGDIAASMDLLNMYEAGDVRRDSMFLEPAAYPGEFWTLKYPGRLGAIREFNTPVLRLSEMYLIRAEAIMEGASVSGVAAVDDYNAIRTNRGLAEVSSVTLQDIYDERSRELCFEGHEFFDLKRTQRDLDRTDYTGTDREDVQFVEGGTPLENYLWALPIPKFELDANDNMEQNPGY